MQSLKAKKAKALARGYGQWRDKGSGGRGNGSGLSTTGYVKGGYYRMSLREAKAKSKCAKCNQVGHWHRDPECPKNQGTSNNNKPKDVNYIEKKTISDSEEGLFCGLLEDSGQALRPGQEVLSDTLKAATESFMSGNPDNSSSHDGHFGLNKHGEFSNGRQAESSNFVREYKDHRNGSCFVGSGDFVGPGVFDDCVFKDNRRNFEHDVYWSSEKKSEGSDISSDDLCATLDTGCQRMAIGLETLKRLDAALPDGLQTNLVPQEHRFRSVHGTSTTKFVAVIPTSLGTKGSLLRPAVFDNKESQQAPFLISLPFLLHCRAVIHLDPKQGLRIYFKRFGFAVKCHIGPTGALRVPLSEFSGKNLDAVKRAQDAFQENCKEFEILRTTTAFERDSGSRSSTACQPWTLAMESRGVTKRPRQAADEAVEPLVAWRRLVLKLLMVMANVTEMAMKLLMPIKENRQKPFSAWPTTAYPTRKTPDAESLGSFHLIAEEDEEDEIRSNISQRYSSVTPTSPAPSYTESQMADMRSILTDLDLELMGRPPYCHHQEEARLWMTRKLGPNYGRAFWRCPRARGDQCNFFGWTQHQPTWLPQDSLMNPGTTSMPATPPLPRGTRSSPSTPGATSTASPRTTTSKCRHKNVTRQGSTGTTIQEKCKDCSKILKKGPRDTESESNSSQTKTKKEKDEYKEFQEFRKWQKGRRQMDSESET